MTLENKIQEPAEYSETEDSVTITIEGIQYTLSRELTGEQYLTLKQKAVRSVSNGASEFQADETKLVVDSDQYNLWSLILRLTEPELTPDQIKSLKRRVYQPLMLLSIRLDVEEANSIGDFLSINSQRFQPSPSNLEPYSDSPQSISEASIE